jgi:hypothetical protein
MRAWRRPVRRGELGPVSARGLRTIERSVGGAIEDLGFLAVHRITRDAEADGHLPGQRITGDDPGDREACSFGEREAVLLRGLGEDHRELLATDTADDVSRSEELAQRAPHEAERVIADFMTERIVDRLEVVDIQHDDG